MTTATTIPTREALRAHLVASGIAGDVATTREANLRNYQRMSEREPLYLLGLRPRGAWTFAEVLRLMAERCGVSPDPSYVEGPDTIDPDRTIERLEALADRLRRAAGRRERVLVATGHPVGLRPVHTAIARTLREAGCPLVTHTPDWRHPDHPGYPEHGEAVRYLDDVAVLLGVDGAPEHTHSPLPLQAVLDGLAAAGEPYPELVVADHGWAGAAGEAGLDAVGFADCNDPALFVGEAEGTVQVCVPLDDNLDPVLYAPLTAYVLDRAGLAG